MRTAPWRPTASHLRAIVIGTLLALAAVAFGRADLLVLGTPLLVIGAWSAYTRPTKVPKIQMRLLHETLREGEATALRTVVHNVPHLEYVVCVVAPGPFTVLRPRSGVISTAAPQTDTFDLDLPMRSTRWGRRKVGPALVVGSSAWNAFRWISVEIEPFAINTLPVPAVFDSAAPTPHPNGLVGLNRSRRPGDGSEFASIRPFQVGDRLRRIHWPVSMRTRTLHVTSTWADQDSEVALVVDASSDVGKSEGIDGRASSLDQTVRATGAIAEHYLRRGDRVGVQIFGAAKVGRVPTATGKRHLRRVLDTLSLIEPATERLDRSMRNGFVMSGDAFVIMLSPLVSAQALTRVVGLAARGLSVVVVDTLPVDIAADGEDEAARIAWRIRLLEREREIRRVQELGVPVVRWRGPGSLDQVLRDAGRRAAAPRMARR